MDEREARRAEGLTAGRERFAGEIIEAASNYFVVQSARLHVAPPFGSLVSTAAGLCTLYAVVAETRTGSLESGGRPIARGHADVMDDAIYQANPDLEHVLRTEFRALVVGYDAGTEIHQHLPPLPPSLHYSVYTCTAAERCAFSERLDYLRTLLAAPAALADELTAANVRLAAAARGADADAFLLRVGRELAVILRDDYDRLAALLRRLRPEEARR